MHVGSAAALLLAGCASEPAVAAAAACEAEPWPLWSAFRDRFVQADGRVVDHSVAELHSTTEGQSYGMFYALVANDRASFDRLWNWSVANLAGGDIQARLPAWRWGRRSDGSWGVIDPNPASDADLWFAYALLEAARAWHVPRYREEARALLSRIASEEVIELPGFGTMLLPGPSGFVGSEGRLWRLNPSYLPLPLLRRFASEQRKGPWAALAANLPRLLEGISPRGLAPDWAAYSTVDVPGGAFVVDPDKKDVGGYDAIRTYLWAGMTAAADPLAASVLRRLGGMTAVIGADGAPAEFVQAQDGSSRGKGPVGFSAALLPYLAALRQTQPLAQQQARVRAQLLDTIGAPREKAPPYYDHVLGLFGTGWTEQRYRFLPSGALELRWEKACPRATTANNR